MRIDRKRGVILFCVVGLALLAGLGVTLHATVPQEEPKAARPADDQAVVLTELQLKRVRVEPVKVRDFADQRETLGYVDFNQDRSSAISPPYPGRILTISAQVGDDVNQGSVLFTIESPDLIQAESGLIAAAGVLKLTTSVLERDRGLFAEQGIPQKELDQAISDQQSADAAYRTARDAVRVFGKTDAEIERILSSRQTDASMLVRAPMAGRITQRNAAVGMLVQPGMTPPPFVVSDIRTMWLLAAVPEADVPVLKLGQRVDVKISALPGRTFQAVVSNVGETVDPTTRRVLVRSEIKDPKHELRPQMFASFAIQTGAPQPAPAVPAGGVVRQGDGTMIIWVTTDGKRFVERPVKIGLVQDGYSQILSGVNADEQVATDGALFLSNALATANQ